MDADGFLFVVDRSKDMIVSGGENVYSTEVEDALYRHPAVLEAAVFGIPDADWGEAVHAVVVPRPGHEQLDPAELIAFCRQQIAAYKVPKRIDPARLRAAARAAAEVGTREGPEARAAGALLAGPGSRRQLTRRPTFSLRR